MRKKLAVPQLSIVSQCLTEWQNTHDSRPSTYIRTRHLSIHYESRFVIVCILEPPSHITPQTQIFPSSSEMHCACLIFPQQVSYL